MPEADFYPRFASDRLTGALHDSPAVLIHGPRQSGKTTLAQRVGARAGYAYLSFDDEAIRSVARADPVGFVADLPPRVILDEVQHVPQLFVTLKAAITSPRANRPPSAATQITATYSWTRGCAGRSCA